jgi:hypothetical protein
MAKAKPARSNTAAAGAEVPPGKAVVTVHGLCEHRAAAAAKQPVKPSECVTVLTRRQMEAVTDVVRATGKSVLAPQRRDVAAGYVELMANAAAAEKAGVDKDPRFAEVLRLARMKALNDMYRVRLEEQANNVPDADVKAYYDKNIANFEELNLSHVALPRYNSANLKDPEFEAKARKLAYDMRERLAKGEDIGKLEKEGIDALGIKKPPTTGMAPVRRGVYAKEQEEMLFALQPGDVTKVIEQASSFIIFKLESRGTPPLSDVKAEIHSKLYTQRLDALRAATTASIHADYNDEYFGPAPTSAWVHVGDQAGREPNKPATSK